MIEIISATALATVQDTGRSGSLGYGVGTSGAMDQLALAVGNLLLGNPEGAAAIEIPLFPFEVRFIQDCAFAVTGAAGEATLDGQPLLPYWVMQAREGQVREGQTRNTPYASQRRQTSRGQDQSQAAKQAPTSARRR